MSTEASLARGWALMDLRRHEEALALAGGALASDPEDVDLHALAGAACIHLERWAEAERFARAVIGMAPEAAVGHALLGHVRHHESPRLAEPCFREALALDPEEPGRHAMLGLVLGHMGRLEEGITAARKGLRLDPEDAFSLFVLQQLYRLDDDAEMAAEMGRRALAVDAESSSAHFELGLARLEQGDAGAARASFFQSLRLDPRAGDRLEDIAHERVRTHPIFRNMIFPPTRWPLWLVACASPLMWFGLALLWSGFAWVGWLAAALLALGYGLVGVFELARRHVLRRLRKGEL